MRVSRISLICDIRWSVHPSGLCITFQLLYLHPSFNCKLGERSLLHVGVYLPLSIIIIVALLSIYVPDAFRTALSMLSF